MENVTLVDVAKEVGLDFRHGAFQWGASPDVGAMMGGGVCWIDYDGDGWMDLFAVNTWTENEWGRWRPEGGLPTTRLYRNDRGRFTDVTDDTGTGVEVRGNGCVAADLDRDGNTDLYVSTERENVLLWNEGGDRFEQDDGSAGLDSYGWHSGLAVGDVDGDDWPDIFIAGYVDPNRPNPDADQGFPNTVAAEPDLLMVSQGAERGERPRFVDVADDVGIEEDRVDYGLAATFTDVDHDGDLDLHVINDTQPNRLYVNEPDPDDAGFRLVDEAPASGVDDDNAGMGLGLGDYNLDGGADVAVTNMQAQGHAVFRSRVDEDPPAFTSALAEMGQPDLGKGLTGWGVTWVDLDLDTDLDLVLAHGALPITAEAEDAQQLQVYENRTAQGDGAFIDATDTVGLTGDGRFVARGLAAADYDNDGDVDLAVGTIGGDLALLRNNGAGGHALVVAPEPATPGTTVRVTLPDGTVITREIAAGSSYLSSEDPRPHVGLGAAEIAAEVAVRWPDGSEAILTDVEADQVLEVTADR